MMVSECQYKRLHDFRKEELDYIFVSTITNCLFYLDNLPEIIELNLLNLVFLCEYVIIDQAICILYIPYTLKQEE